MYVSRGWPSPSRNLASKQPHPPIFHKRQPTANPQNARIANIYAIPSLEYRGLTKVLVHSGPEADPDARDHVDLQPTVDYVSRYVKEHMPRLDHTKPAILETCMYTVRYNELRPTTTPTADPKFNARPSQPQMTPDSKPLIDLYHVNVAVGTGFSGSGFKHAPACGLMVASLLLRTAHELPEDFHIQKYRISRFEDGETFDLRDAGRLLDEDGRSML